MLDRSAVVIVESSADESEGASVEGRTEDSLVVMVRLVMVEDMASSFCDESDAY